MTVGKSGLDTGNVLGYPWQMWQTLKHRLLASAGAQVQRNLFWLSLSSERDGYGYWTASTFIQLLSVLVYGIY